MTRPRALGSLMPGVHVREDEVVFSFLIKEVLARDATTILVTGWWDRSAAGLTGPQEGDFTDKEEFPWSAVERITWYTGNRETPERPPPRRPAPQQIG